MLTRYHLELGFAAAVLLFGAVMVAGALQLNTGWADGGPQAGFFPFRVGILLIVASILVIVQAVRGRSTLARIAVADREGAGRALAFGAPIVGFVVASYWLGLYVGTLLYLVVSIRFVGRRSWTTALAVAAVTTAATFVLFEWVFKVPLLKGPLEELLGLG